MSLNIKEVEDKGLGLRTLGSMASALELDFLPYLDRTSRLMVPCITYKLSDAVRSSAIDGMESLLRVAKAAVARGVMPPQGMEQLWREMFPLLMQAAIMEPDAETQASIYEAVAECMGACGPNCLSSDQQLALCQAIEPFLKDRLQPKKPEEEEEEEEDFDEVCPSAARPPPGQPPCTSPARSVP